MNLDRIQTSPAAPPVRPGGRRLDVTLSEPARPAVAADAGAPQVGTIRGVLTQEENRAIAALFDSSGRVYASNGGARQQSVPGVHLDLQA